MKGYLYLIAVLTPLLLLLSACETSNDPIVQNTPSEEEIRIIEITVQPTARPTPFCPDASSFGQLQELQPVMEDFLTSPKFIWHYSDGVMKNNITDWLDTCVPESYSLYLSTGPDFNDEIEIPVTDPLVGYDIVKIALEWDLDAPLEPMTIYRWVAVGHYGDIDIDLYQVGWLHIDSLWRGESIPNGGRFRTGPMCAYDAIDTPVLLYPADGESISTYYPRLTWEVDTCLPHLFKTQLSRMPNLDALDPWLNSFSIADYTLTLQTRYPWLELATIGNLTLPPLPDCTTYYWRVMGAVVDYDLEGTDRAWGQWSDIHTFYVNSGSCPTATPIPTVTYTPIPTNTPKPPPTSTPKPTAVDCSVYKDIASCNANPQCYWKASAVSPTIGECVKK